MTVLFLAFISTGIFAKPMQVEILGENWNFGYDIGDITQYEAIAKNQKFQYKAFIDAKNDSLKTFLTFFIEPVAGQSQQTCYKEFWNKAVIYPFIEPKTIKHQSFPRYEQGYLYHDGT